jgi:phosphoglycolate phosphatase
VRLVLFDCDGTLVDSQVMIVASMTGAFVASGRPPPPRAAVLSIVGLSLPVAVSRLVPGADAEAVDALVAAYKASFQSLRGSKDHLEPLYPGALSALATLAARDDVLLGVVTGKSRRGLDMVLAHHGLSDRFVVLRTADDAPSKPHPRMVLDAVAATGAEIRRTVVVGDTTYDIEMARAAGCRSIGVTWGYHAPEALAAAGADMLTTRFDDVPAAIDALLPA